MDNEHDPIVRAFLNVAFDSLTFARSYSGRGSATYRSMARDYRRIGDFLGCRRDLERILHPLRRYSVGEPRNHRWRRT